MIEVKFRIFKNGQMKFSCKGHAGSGEHGHDLVCAGASALAYGFLENLHQSKDMIEEFQRTVVKDGIMELSFKPKEEYINSIALLVTAKRNEFKALERGHEEYIKVW